MFLFSGCISYLSNSNERIILLVVFVLSSLVDRQKSSRHLEKVTIVLQMLATISMIYSFLSDKTSIKKLMTKILLIAKKG